MRILTCDNIHTWEGENEELFPNTAKFAMSTCHWLPHLVKSAPSGVFKTTIVLKGTFTGVNAEGTAAIWHDMLVDSNVKNVDYIKKTLIVVGDADIVKQFWDAVEEARKIVLTPFPWRLAS